jgi:hypothetical protein|tara:strand:+ start:6392 stop:7378 length:987 start_codon:yes stop_codon:yes gene_type:complete
MIKNKEKEDVFYAKKDFCFSYSSLNKLLFSPSLFYKEYILFDREVRTDKHLIEGKLVHCLLFEPENVLKKFNLVPGRAPSDNIKKVMKDMSLYTDAETLADCSKQALLSLKALNLFQSLKTDEQRLKKVIVPDNEPYWSFLNNANVDVIDHDTMNKCLEKVEILKQNADVMALFKQQETDFELDPIETHAEAYLKSKLTDNDFGLHGYIDFYKVDHDKKEVTICDLKTTGKTISDFRDTVDFYNYWLQAAIYCKLVYDTLGDKAEEYTIKFKFVVIDTYKQVYVFDVTDETLVGWADGLEGVIKVASYHYKEKNYQLPYDFLIGNIKL